MWESSCGGLLPAQETLEQGSEASRGGQMNKSHMQLITLSRTVHSIYPKCVSEKLNTSNDHRNWSSLALQVFVPDSISFTFFPRPYLSVPSFSQLFSTPPCSLPTPCCWLSGHSPGVPHACISSFHSPLFHFPTELQMLTPLWPKTRNKLATDFPLPSLWEQTWGWCSSPSHESVKEVLVPPGLATVSLELLAQLMPISEKRLNRAQEKCYQLSAK